MKLKLIRNLWFDIPKGKLHSNTLTVLSKTIDFPVQPTTKIPLKMTTGETVTLKNIFYDVSQEMFVARVSTIYYGTDDVINTEEELQENLDYNWYLKHLKYLGEYGWIIERK